MTERRTTITLKWRSTGAPAARIDDFQEADPTPIPAPAPAKPAPARVVERRSIGRRLENWGAWANMDNRGGGRGGDCMTGVVCENMRRYAAGVIGPPAPVNDRIDVPDAEHVNRAFLKLAEADRKVLSWTYVAGLKPWGVAGACGFPTREYDQRLAAAQAAIESVVKNMERLA